MKNVFKKENLTTKEKIIYASLVEFGEQGLAGARVDKIAETAGVNKAMIYYHFTSKQQLYWDVIRYHIQQMASALKENIDINSSLEELLAQVAEVYAVIFTYNPNMRQIFVRELAPPESAIIDIIADTMQASDFPTIIATKMAGEMEAGKVRQLDIRQTIVSFITMNIGYFIMSPIVNKVQKIEDPQKFIDERKYAVVDLFLNGVLKK